MKMTSSAGACLKSASENYFPARVREPEIRRLGAQRQHCGINGNHAEKL